MLPFTPHRRFPPNDYDGTSGRNKRKLGLTLKGGLEEDSAGLGMAYGDTNHRFDFSQIR
jgi:hypothetical protein